MDWRWNQFARTYLLSCIHLQRCRKKEARYALSFHHGHARRVHRVHLCDHAPRARLEDQAVQGNLCHLLDLVDPEDLAGLYLLLDLVDLYLLSDLEDREYQEYLEYLVDLEDRDDLCDLLDLWYLRDLSGLLDHVCLEDRVDRALRCLSYCYYYCCYCLCGYDDGDGFFLERLYRD